MTKSTMINTIQERELELYESLRLAKRVFGGRFQRGKA